MKISICIPTFNRAEHLSNCLNSILLNRDRENVDFEICVSDNNSNDQTESVVQNFEKTLPIRYWKNEFNMGVARNVLKVVDLAEGDFVWLIGDDDLLLPNAVKSISDLISNCKNIDYFYINSFHLTTEIVQSFPQPFDTVNLPKKMERFSSWKADGELKFIELIDPKFSFDFLGGMFLSVFRRRNWVEKRHAVNQTHLLDERRFSFFDNTFVHVKIFANAFSNSKAFFYSSPLSVCLSGAREWVPMYPLVRSVRLVEALDEYRKNGLSFLQYLKCRNYTLKFFIPDLIFMILHRRESGISYINPIRVILSNCIYPNFYLSFFYFFIRKLSGLFRSK
ncbi:glycosyltransferase family 2 protein [Leptospira sp. 201903071]|uniref:glycosyltransferase family 2 protein n=1 Tax=Leptospira ainazelensis TaxID=2810034 RepID=UPI0019636B2E|nr:glycosyltransferase family 2 protein [Leptospira ainazelensis]MBM9501967.1 glycosyltransferase family 2 protein [Leptospira ainazelensis]